MARRLLATKFLAAKKTSNIFLWAAKIWLKTKHTLDFLILFYLSSPPVFLRQGSCSSPFYSSYILSRSNVIFNPFVYPFVILESYRLLLLFRNYRDQIMFWLKIILGGHCLIRHSSTLPFKP